MHVYMHTYLHIYKCTYTYIFNAVNRKFLLLNIFVRPESLISRTSAHFIFRARTGFGTVSGVLVSSLQMH